MNEEDFSSTKEFALALESNIPVPGVEEIREAWKPPVYVSEDDPILPGY